MQPLTIYEELVKLRDNPEEFEKRSEEIWEEFFESLPSREQEKRARQFKWEIDGKLKNFKDPTARLNEMIRLFWQGFQAFQLSLSNPHQLIAKSQDGSKAVVIPIDKPTRDY